MENVSVRTVRRRLAESGLNGRIACKKPFISKANMVKRKKFAQEHLSWSKDDWAKVLWSDESKFNLCNSDGIRYVRRPVNTRFDPKYTIGTVKHGGGNIMCWGCFSLSGLGPLHRIDGKMDQVVYREILENVMLPHARAMNRGWIFQHDNDPKHTAKSVKNWLVQKKIKVMEWPAQSPDLNPIENLWGEVERKLRGQKFKKPDDLFQAVDQAWHSIPEAFIEKLIESMPRRCQAILKAKGAATKY